MDYISERAVLVAQHAAAFFYHELAAASGHYAPEQQHMAEVVHIVVERERVRQIHADAAVYRGGAVVPLFHELLHDLELFRRRKRSIQLDTRARSELYNAVLREILHAAADVE